MNKKIPFSLATIDSTGASHDLRIALSSLSEITSALISRRFRQTRNMYVGNCNIEYNPVEILNLRIIP